MHRPQGRLNVADRFGVLRRRLGHSRVGVGLAVFDEKGLSEALDWECN
jgi:hypothetical protein